MTLLAFSLTWSGPDTLGSVPTVVIPLTTSSVDPTDLAALMAAIESWGNDFLVPIMIDDYALSSVKVYTDTLEVSDSFNISGTRTGTGAPPQLAVLVHKGTGFRGRSMRGRTYWPALLNAEDITPSGHIGVDVQAAVQNAMNSLQTALLSVNSCTLAIHHPDGSNTAVLTYGVEGQVATQRRRNRK